MNRIRNVKEQFPEGMKLTIIGRDCNVEHPNLSVDTGNITVSVLSIRRRFARKDNGRDIFRTRTSPITAKRHDSIFLRWFRIICGYNNSDATGISMAAAPTMAMAGLFF